MDYHKFIYDSIKNGGVFMSWLEMRRLEFAPLMASRLSGLLDGKSFIMICDENRKWYQKYFLQNINSSSDRPFVPIFAIDNFYKIKDDFDIVLINDLLDFSFPNGFVYFYVGTYTDKMAKLAKSKEDSLLWLFDEQLQNSFFLDSKDTNIDEKLITLYKLFDKSIDAILFSKVEF